MINQRNRIKITIKPLLYYVLYTQNYAVMRQTEGMSNKNNDLFNDYYETSEMTFFFNRWIAAQKEFEKLLKNLCDHVFPAACPVTVDILLKLWR